MGELLPFCCVGKSCVTKGESVREGFTNKVRLTDPASAIHGNKFGFVRFIQTNKFFNFFVSTNHFKIPLADRMISSYSDCVNVCH